MTVDANRIPPIHQRNAGMERRFGTVTPDVSVLGNSVVCLPAASELTVLD
jgi:hypothetical protein